MADIVNEQGKEPEVSKEDMEKLESVKKADAAVKSMHDFTSPEVLYNELIASIKKYHPSTDITMIQKAYETAREAHKDQKRTSGEPYIIHPLCVAIYPGTYHFVSYSTVHAVCKINGGRAVRKGFHISLWSKAVYTVCKQIQIIFQKTHELFIIGHVSLPFQDLAQPVQLLLLTIARGSLTVRSLFIFPMCSNTVLGSLMHLKGSDLNFKRLSIRSDQRGMQRLVHIWFGQPNYWRSRAFPQLYWICTA